MSVFFEKNSPPSCQNSETPASTPQIAIPKSIPARSINIDPSTINVTAQSSQSRTEKIIDRAPPSALGLKIPSVKHDQKKHFTAISGGAGSALTNASIASEVSDVLQGDAIRPIVDENQSHADTNPASATSQTTTAAAKNETLRTSDQPDEVTPTVDAEATGAPSKFPAATATTESGIEATATEHKVAEALEKPDEPDASTPATSAKSTAASGALPVTKANGDFPSNLIEQFEIVMSQHDAACVVLRPGNEYALPIASKKFESLLREIAAKRGKHLRQKDIAEAKELLIAHAEMRGKRDDV